MFYEQSEDHRPLFWMNGHPIYVNTLIFGLHILAFLATALAVAVLGAGVLNAISLDTYPVIHFGQVWRLVSYIIFPPNYAISFIFAMGFLFYFGKQVEEFVGRKVYFNLFAALVLIPSFLLCLLGLLGMGWSMGYMGGYGSIFGIFVAFATIYPGVQICIWFVNLSAKYWAIVLLAVLTAANIAGHEWVTLAGLWCDAAIGYLGMRLIGAGQGMSWLTDWLDERRAARLARKHNIKVLEEKKTTESIDAILDKISKHGVASLDPREKAALERARANLLKRDQR